MKKVSPICSKFAHKQGVAVTWTALPGRKVQCGESQWHFPHKPPNGGGAHDAQGLLLRRVDQVVVAMNTKGIDAPTAMLEASRRKIYLSKTACKIPNTLPNECEVLFLHNEVAGSSAAWLLQKRICKSLPWDFTTKS